jgi:hypothetical protein
MVTALQAGEIDIGVGLTEGWIAALGKAQAAKQDAGFKRPNPALLGNINRRTAR